MKKVNLKDKPYYLNDEQISFVKKIVSSLTLEDKLKQLFYCLGAKKDSDYLKEICSTYKFGGYRYNPLCKEDVYKQNYDIQSFLQIPAFIAANCEAGGDGAAKGGTCVGCESKIAATKDTSLAYQLGYISSLESKSIGVNTIFSPIVDIYKNFRNPIISNRSFGSDPKLVLKMSKAFLKGCKKNNVIACAKHFPGDGIDERDQHLSPSINTLTKDEWDSSFGYVYKGLIEDSLPMIMVGHISLPCYNKNSILPATVSINLIDGLLKTKLCFNGVVTSDATHMVALTSCMKRSEFLPKMIQAGLDMILFYNDFDEDMSYMIDGYKKGIIQDDRLNDALYRIIGLKVAYKIIDVSKMFNSNILNKQSLSNNSIKDNDFDSTKLESKSIDTSHQDELKSKNLKNGIQSFESVKVDIESSNDDLNKTDDSKLKMDLSNIGLQTSIDVSNEVCKKAITLVKKEDGVLPLSLDKYKKILLVYLTNDNPFAFMMPKTPTIIDYIKDKLTKEGFEVEIFESNMDKAKSLPINEAMGILNNVYNNKTPIKSLKENYDLIINFCYFDSHNTVDRISYKMSKGTPDIPFYVNEVKTIMISLHNPFHLFDAPQIKTYINCYDKNKNTIDYLIEKLMGRDEFLGKSPFDCFCKDLLAKKM